MSTPTEDSDKGPVPTPADIAAMQQAAKAQEPETPADTFSREYVEQLRDENKKRRLQEQALNTQLAELQEWKQQQERAALSAEEQAALEWQELQEGKAAAEQRAAEFQLQYEVALHASTLGIRDPQDAVRLINWDRLEFNESGDVANMGEVLKELLDAKPYLRGGQTAPITPATPVDGNPGRDREGHSELTLAQVKAMTPDQIAARWDEVRKVLARG